MYKSIALVAMCGFLWFGSVSQAAIVSTSPSTVKSQTVISYAAFGGGDIVFQLTTNSLSECGGGFWLRATDPGFKNNLAILLAQAQAGGAVTVAADDSQIWTGSSTPFCLVYCLIF